MANKKVENVEKRRHSKRLHEVKKGLDRAKMWTLEEAVAFAKQNASAKFDETIEIAVALGIDVKKSDQQVRGMCVLPNGNGKTVRVAVFAKGMKADEAKKAGADIVGEEDLAEMIKKGQMDFERCIATPDMMPLVGRLGQILGPKGLMPNPKLGTVTMDVTGAIKAAKGGAVEYRAEKAGIVHLGVGKASFTVEQLLENIKTVYEALLKAKPQTSKGVYIKTFSVSSTMGAGLKVSIDSLGSKAA